MMDFFIRQWLCINVLGCFDKRGYRVNFLPLQRFSLFINGLSQVLELARVFRQVLFYRKNGLLTLQPCYIYL